MYKNGTPNIKLDVPFLYVTLSCLIEHSPCSIEHSTCHPEQSEGSQDSSPSAQNDRRVQNDTL